MGVISDLDEPERAMVEMSVVARHSGMVGTTPEVEGQETCHLRRVTAEVRKLKKPRWAWQGVQKTLRLWGWVGVEGRVWVEDEPCAYVDWEN